MDVLILMNVSKEVIIATHMLRVTTREEHFIVNVTLVSKVVVLPVMILMNAHKPHHWQRPLGLLLRKVLKLMLDFILSNRHLIGQIELAEATKAI